MTRRLLLLATLVVAMAYAPSVGAQDGGSQTFELIAKNPEYVWTNAAGETNPTLLVPAGAQISVTIKNDEMGGFHAFSTGGEQSSDITEGGDTATLTFTAPTSGEQEYACPYHSSMKGTIRVASADDDDGSTGGTPTPTESGNGTPGFTALMATAGLALGALLILRRR